MSSLYTSSVAFCWIALLVTGILVHENSRLDHNARMRFYRTYILIMFATLAEWLGVLLNGTGEQTRILHIAAKTLDYIMSPAVGLCFLYQVKSSDSKFPAPLLCVLIANITLAIVSAFTGWAFYLDSDNYYHHGPLYPLYMVFYLFITISAILEYLRYARGFKKQNDASAFAILIMILLGIAAQEIFGVRTICLSLTMASPLLFIHYSEFNQLKQDDDLSIQQKLLETDVMTGLLSRYAYTGVLRKFESAAELPDDLLIISIDINELKQVNDQLGHPAGDALIRGAAECIATYLNPYGKCYRTGGDEFVAILRPQNIRAEDLIHHLKESTRKWHSDYPISLSLSIGYAYHSEYQNLPIEKLIGEADKQMYRAKAAYYTQSGKDRRK